MDAGDDHPLALEISSLRTAVSRLQNEAHASALKLQRHSLDTSNALERAHLLDRENAVLKEELNFLRSTPDTSLHPATIQAQELTLALRRSSDRQTLTEQTVLSLNTELAHLKSSLAKAKLDAEAAYELASRTRGREEEGKVREQELKRKIRGVQEEKNMVELAVREYADLVRSLEGRAHPIYANEDASSSTTLVSSLNDGKSGLHKLLSEFSDETSALEAEIGRLQADLSISEAKLEVERKREMYDYDELGRARLEIEKRKVDDASAAGIVSRYMSFSQQTTNALQSALSTLKSRHATTLSSHAHQLRTLETLLRSTQLQSAHMRDALDELGGEMMREMSGRRREVALRLATIGREERIKSRLELFARRAGEIDVLSGVVNVKAAVHELVHEAQRALQDLEGEAGESRVLAAEIAVNTLVGELERETERRVRLEILVGKREGNLVHGLSMDADEALSDSNPFPECVIQTPPTDTSADVPFPVTEDLVQSVEDDPPTQVHGEEFPGVVTGAHLDLHQSLMITPQVAMLPFSPTASPAAPISPSPIPSPLEANVEPPQPHRLLSDFARVKNRYDILQRQFRDCHLTLRDLQHSLSTSTSLTSHPSPSVVLAALSRLDDYNEDARVELEIRIADEELTLRGYTTLLSIPDALPSEPEMLELEAKVINFINGEDEGVKKALKVFGQKADDLQHDIAILKRIVYEPPNLLSPSQEPQSSLAPSWSSWILGTGSSPSTIPPPTFGNVMTTPRLRHSSSITFQKMADSSDPFSGLGLKVPMPLTSTLNGIPHHGNEKRERKVSMFMLGLGARSPVEGRSVSVSGEMRKGGASDDVGDDVE